MNLFEIMQNEQMKLRVRCQKDVRKIDEMIKWQSLSSDQVAFLSQLKQIFFSCDQAIKNIGYSMPEFFVGDLLDFDNYVKYFDSIFYQNDDKLMDKEPMQKGNEKLNFLACEVINRNYKVDTWRALDRKEQAEIIKRVKSKIVLEKIDALPSTRIIDGRLQDEKHTIESNEKLIFEVEQQGYSL